MAFTYTIRTDGRLMKRINLNGKTRSLYSDNPKDLEQQYIELKYLSNRGVLAEDNGLNVSKWSKEWF